MLKTLLKKQMAEIFRNYFYDPKKNKMRSRGATIAYIALYVLLMAGVLGGGGLGDIAIRYGYYRWQGDVMWVTVILLVALVQILQGIGMLFSKKLDHRRH